MVLSPVEMLLDARVLLVDHWTHGAFARDVDGKPVEAMSDKAVSFDLLGSLVRASGNNGWKPVSEVFSECMGSIPLWQDNATLEEVLACVDETIATLRSRNGSCLKERMQ